MWIAYFYVMRDDADRIRAVTSDHARDWHDLELAGYVGGRWRTDPPD
jgi:hypothetical protein